MLSSFGKRYPAITARLPSHAVSKLPFIVNISGRCPVNFETGRVSGEPGLLKHRLRENRGAVLNFRANVGDCSATPRAVNPQLEADAFAPQPRSFRHPCARLSQTRLTAHNVAAGGTVGTHELFEHATGDGSDQATPYRCLIDILPGGKALAHPMRMISLGHFVREHDGKGARNPSPQQQTATSHHALPRPSRPAFASFIEIALEKIFMTRARSTPRNKLKANPVVNPPFRASVLSTDLE